MNYVLSQYKCKSPAHSSTSSTFTLTSCLTLSSALVSCCCMSSSRSVSWLLFISSTLFEQKRTSEFMKSKQCQKDWYSRWKVKTPSRRPIPWLFWLHLVTVVTALLLSDNTRTSQRGGRDGFKQSRFHRCTRLCQWGYSELLQSFVKKIYI